MPRIRELFYVGQHFGKCNNRVARQHTVAPDIFRTSEYAAVRVAQIIAVTYVCMFAGVPSAYDPVCFNWEFGVCNKQVVSVGAGVW